MKKLILTFFVLVAVIFSLRFAGKTTETTDAKLYLVDRHMLSLIPVQTKIPLSSPEHQAENIIKLLLSPHSRNSSFTGYISEGQGEISVSVRGETATVDFDSDLLGYIPKDRHNQKLFIYQIVNSLCSISDIQYVKFTIDNKNPEDILDFINLRELFSANYDI